jgi:hypothetical protein
MFISAIKCGWIILIINKQNTSKVYLMVLFQDVYLSYMNQSVQLRVYHTHPTRREKSRSFQILYQYKLPQQIHKITQNHTEN